MVVHHLYHAICHVNASSLAPATPVNLAVLTVGLGLTIVVLILIVVLVNLVFHYR